MYQLTKDPRTDEVNGVCKDDKYGIPFDPANTDYQAFKKAVLEQEPGSDVVEDGE